VRLSVAALVGWFACVCVPAANADELGGADDIVTAAPERTAAAPQQPLELRADSLEYERARDLYVARGEVVIRQGDRELAADWMAFSNRTRRAVASGNVVFTDGIDTVRTSFAEFDVDDLTGVMFDASFDVPSGHFTLEGATIAKTGDRTYAFEEGEFTTCRCADPDARKPWRIKADQVDLEVGGYGTARNSTFEVLGVPVMWLPWAIYPLKTERQSGLLFPEFRLSGRNGIEIGLPVFWAAADPVNVTATPRWLQDRGAKGDLEVEYVLGQRSGGDLFGSYLRDQKIDPDSRAEPFDRNRWATSGREDWHLPAGFRFRTDFQFVSDNSSPNDFEDLDRWRRFRYMRSTAFVGTAAGPSGAYGLVAAADHYDDLQNPDDTDRDDFVLQRLPEVSLHALPAPVELASWTTWLVPALDVEYVWFQSPETPRDPGVGNSGSLVTSDGRFLDTGVDGLSSVDEQGRDPVPTDPNDPNEDNAPGLLGGSPGGTEGDGRFQEGELLADRGHRLVLTPRLGDAVEIYPEAGWYQTLYESHADGFEQRGIATGRVELRTVLRRRFGSSVSHLLEPRLGWAGIARTSNRRDKPLWLPGTALPQRRIRELDLENVTRDPADRIRSFNGVTFGFGNRFFAAPEGEEAARLLADVTLLGQYDFAHSEWGGVVLDGAVHPWRSVAARFNARFDPERTRIDEGMLEFAWRSDAGHRVGLRYRYLREIPDLFGAFPRENDRFKNFRSDFDRINQIGASIRVALTERWAVGYRGAYSFERSLFLANTGTLEYVSGCGCWAAAVDVSEDRSRGAAIRLRYTLTGLGKVAERPFDAGAPIDFGSLDALGGV
jgi:hypothetical protein